MRIVRRTLIALALIAAGAGMHALYAQATQPTFDGTFRHVGFVVHDADKAAADFTNALGMTANPMHTVAGTMVWPEGSTYDRKTAIKTTELRGKGFELHLLQPIGGSSPWKDHLDKHGDSLQHISFGVRDLKGAVTLLQQLGGRVTTGGADSFYAYMEMPQLPFTIELEKIP